MPSSKKRIVILGSTGSIGTQTLDVVLKHDDKLTVVGLSAHRNAALLFEQARRFDVSNLAVTDESCRGSLETDRLGAWSSNRKGFFGVGPEAALRLIHESDADIVVNALVGAAGLKASYETLAVGKTLALANKESLVVGGDLIMPLAAREAARRGERCVLLPIDSEHGALFQCLLGERHAEVSRLWVTASGGPFRGKTRDQLKQVMPTQALAHPTWHMGAKITIDSSTLMNKGLEVIEAHHLFAVDYDRIKVVIQPQSAIHSMVEFIDGSVKAHLGTTDMRIPIQYALSYPERWEAPVSPLDFTKLGSLEFAAPDEATFPCLALAREAGRRGGTLPCAMNAANEVAVALFLKEQISFLSIPACVEAVMEKTNVASVESIEQLEAVDVRAREEAYRFCMA